MVALSRSAQHLARTSATRIAAPAAAACFAKYQYVTKVERAAKLIRGDVLVELIDLHGRGAVGRHVYMRDGGRTV